MNDVNRDEDAVFLGEDCAMVDRGPGREAKVEMGGVVRIFTEFETLRSY
jgi:hypothetical protein